MRFMLVGLLALGASGCASPDGEGQSRSPGVFGVGGPLTDAANIGGNQWMVSCYAALSSCTWRSNQICPAGFKVTDTMAGQETDASFDETGGSLDTSTKYTLMIACN
jgi:hypothetical protein